MVNKNIKKFKFIHRPSVVILNPAAINLFASHMVVAVCTLLSFCVMVGAMYFLRDVEGVQIKLGVEVASISSEKSAPLL